MELLASILTYFPWAPARHVRMRCGDEEAMHASYAPFLWRDLSDSACRQGGQYMPMSAKVSVILCCGWGTVHRVPYLHGL